MSKKKTRKVFSLNREAIYGGDIECPFCGRMVAPYRVAIALETVKFRDIVPDRCPICHK